MISKISAVISGLFLLILGVWTLSRVAFPPETHVKEFVTGKTASKFEQMFDDAFPLKEYLTNAWAAFNYLAFNEGRKGVVVGNDQWLFTTEEFEFSRRNLKNLEDNIAYVHKVSGILNASDVSLTVVLIPEKSEVYSKFLKRESPHVVIGLRQRIMDSLNQQGVASLDLFSVLNSASEPVFLRTDTHWTPFGARLSAKTLSEQFVELKSDQTFNIKFDQFKAHRGDLLGYIPVHPNFSDLGPKEDQLARYSLVRGGSNSDKHSGQSSADLFGSDGITLALVGTSYSANMSWHFADFLKFYLNRDLVNYASEGKGPFVPMDAFLRSDDFKDGLVKSVIWELPVRYFLKSEKDFEEKDDILEVADI